MDDVFLRRCPLRADIWTSAQTYKYLKKGWTFNVFPDDTFFAAYWLLSPTRWFVFVGVQWYAPIKIIGIKIIVPIKSEKSLRLVVHISKALTKSLR